MHNLKRKKENQGFTLIELLIVIVILGILAAALLSAINPLEQIKKSQDSGKKSDAAELLNAMERYYASYQYYPSGDATDVDGDLTTTAQLISGLANVQTALTTANEVKSEFFNRTSMATLYVALDAQGTGHVCFAPDSQTFKDQALAGGRNNDGTSGCAADCYICVPQ